MSSAHEDLPEAQDVRRVPARARRLAETAERFGVTSVVDAMNTETGERRVKYFRDRKLIEVGRSDACVADDHSGCSGDGDEPGPCPCPCHVDRYVQP